MKRLFTSAALFLCSLLTFAQFSGSGSGTEDDPYLIFNETQLSQMANFLNQEGVVFRLMKDLDLTNWIDENSPRQGWQPIGVETSPFKGKLIGNNKTISGLMINRSSSFIGFFGHIEGATITNLTLKGSSVKGSQYVGVFAGMISNSTLDNLKVEMTDVVSGDTYVGGLAGQMSNTTATTLHATIEGGVSGTNHIGGLIGGANSSSVTPFSVSADVTGTEIIGGAFGAVDNGTFTNGTIVGTITASDGKVGGAIGEASNCTMENVTMTGNIAADGETGHVAGLAAVVRGTLTLTQCKHFGDVTGQQVVSGCVGSLEVGASATFTSCSSKGKISNTGNYTGGIVAVSRVACIAAMESCSHFGDIDGKDYIGGIVGAIEGNVQDNPADLWEWYTGVSGSGSDRMPAGDKVGSIQNEAISIGAQSENSINNCTAIGNISGDNIIGGIIGLNVPGVGYTSDGDIYQDFGHWYWLFKNGAFYGNSYGFTYTKYRRNSIKYILTNNNYTGNIIGSENIGGIVGLGSVPFSVSEVC